MLLRRMVKTLSLLMLTPLAGCESKVTVSRSSAPPLGGAPSLYSQVIPAGETAKWEISTGDLSGFTLDYSDTSFQRDATLEIRLLGTPPSAIRITGNQPISAPLLITLPRVIIPEASSLTANLSSMTITFIDDATGELSQLAPLAAGITTGKVQVPISSFGTLTVQMGAASQPGSNLESETAKRNNEEIAKLKAEIEQLKTVSSGISGATFFITAPLAPVAVSSTNVIWQSVPSAQTYTLKIASDATCSTISQTFAGLTTTNKSLTGLGSGISYLCLSAIDSNGVIKQATNNGLELRVDIDAPTVPGIPVSSAATVATNAVSFTWTAATDAGPGGIAYYELQVGTVAGGSDVFNSPVNSSLTRTISGVSDGLYFARVRSVDAVGNASNWSSSSTPVRVDTTPPAPATGLLTTASGPGGSDVRYGTDPSFWVAWSAGGDAGSGVRDYSLTQFTTHSCTGTGTDVFTGITSLSQAVTGVNGSVYSFRVKTVDNAGNVTSSACSGSISIDTTPPPALTTFTATSATSANGVIDLQLVFPASTADYASFSVIRKSGATAPSSCSDGTAILSASTNFTSRTLVDQTNMPGAFFSYLVCIYDLAGNVTASNNQANIQSRARSHMLFATSGAWNGNLGGLAGADAKCTAAASAAGLSMTLPWRALISTNTINANERVVIKGPVFRADGITLIANNFSDLWDGTIANAIQNETGAANVSNIYTGSSAAGATTGHTCADWTHASTDAAGSQADLGAVTSAWIGRGLNPHCSALNGIYCINEYAGQPLTAFNAVTGATTDGTIDLTIDFPTNTAYYGRVDIRRLAGVTAPSADCTADGSVVKSLNTFVDHTWTDTTPVAGGLYSYRACVYDDDANLIKSLSLTRPAVYSKGSYNVMFATSTTTQGNFGGLAGGDAICATRAAAAGLPGHWIALLSSSTIDARDRIFQSGPFYSIDNQLLANDETDLWDGSIASPLLADEFGITTGSNQSVFTGSSPSGLPHHFGTCSNWTSNAASDGVTSGLLWATNLWFGNVHHVANCSQYLRMICISHRNVPNLTTFAAATGSVSDGDINLSWSYPSDTSNYGRIDIRRLEEVVPAKDCSSNGTLVTTITNMTTTTFTDTTTTPGRRFGYRACIYDSDGQLAATTIAPLAFAKGPRHTMFFTNSASFNGNLGGLSGADATCTAAAASAGLTGTWKALLSTNTVHARDRITWVGPIYSTTQGLIAVSSAQLFSGEAMPTMVRDEFGSAGSGSGILSGTNPNGTSVAGVNCSDWTSSDGDAYITSVWDSNIYSYIGLWLSCNQSYRLMCVQ